MMCHAFEQATKTRDLFFSNYGVAPKDDIGLLYTVG